MADTRDNNSPERPKWIDQTPDETSYVLTMYSNEGDAAQEVDITRDEYIELKAHLARIRGISVPAAA